MHSDVLPTRGAGLARLAAFTPRMGRAYAGGRNFDRGPEDRGDVSVLSPYLRRRLVLESEAVHAATDAHGPGAEKFVSEVFWRSYWKGWLESRPAIWHAFQRDLARDRDRLATESGLRRVFHDATEGRTGIDGFDHWARELVERNWLHNHARMWFASIWIFTLRLPWSLGAAFFLRHLLDGDPASNTLSWRWVAGLHTRGKAYVARAENIARYTDGRFDPAGQLDEAPDPLVEADPLPAPRLPPADPPPSGECALLLHDDDLCPETLPLSARIVAIAGCSAPGDVADAVRCFADGAMTDALARAGRHFGLPAERLDWSALPEWAARQPAVVTPYAPIGPAADALAASSIGAARLRRSWDERTWPHSTRGFFQLRDRIPAILREAGG